MQQVCRNMEIIKVAASALLVLDKLTRQAIEASRARSVRGAKSHPRRYSMNNAHALCPRVRAYQS